MQGVKDPLDRIREFEDPNLFEMAPPLGVRYAPGDTTEAAAKTGSQTGCQAQGAVHAPESLPARSRYRGAEMDTTQRDAVAVDGGDHALVTSNSC